MNPTEVICADANEPHATTALSAIIRAMIETESSAIVRYSKRKDSVMLAVLQPHVSDESEYFYVHKLPFAEDIRYYQFAPLDPERARPAFVPSSEQLSAMEDLINDFDLSQASIDEDGYFFPIFTISSHLFTQPLSFTEIQWKLLNPNTHTILLCSDFTKLCRRDH